LPSKTRSHPNLRYRKWQYENQFQKWGFRKNHGGSKTWVYIREKNKRRKIEKKPDGEVFINGILQSPQSIAIGIRRNAYESMIEAHKLGDVLRIDRDF
jgi:hypothetical protein